MNTLSDDILEHTITVLGEEDGNQTKAAKRLGIARSTLQGRLRRGASVGNRSDTGAAGKAPPFEPGTSTLFRGASPEGDVVLQWVKNPILYHKRGPEEVANVIRDTLAEVRPIPVLPERRTDIFRGDLATVYPIADLHLGMYAWDEETGNNYDLEIARRLLLDTMAKLVADSPASDEAVLLNLGDFFHSDSNENRTRRSGNALDVDTRYAKVLSTGVSLVVDVILLALQKHKHVLWRGLPGNHDPYAALALSIALHQRFIDAQHRVTIDTDPSPFFFWRHGKVLVGATHGDMAKPEDMPGIMAAKVPIWWGETDFRYVYTGHLHTKKKGLVAEGRGAEIEVFQTLAPRDAWGNSMGFVAGRSMEAITYHRETGVKERHYEPIGGQR